jgi:hypothetical protein
LEFIRPRAKETVAIDVGAQDDALGFATAGDEDAKVPLDFHINFLQFTPEDAEKGIFGANDGGFPHEPLEDLEKFGEIGVTHAGVTETGRMTSGNAHNDRRQVPPP